MTAARIATAAAVFVALALLARTLPERTAPTTPDPAVAALSARVEELEANLAREAQAHARLAAELAELRAALATREPDAPVAATPPPPVPEAREQAQGGAAPAPEAVERALHAAGFAGDDVERLRERRAAIDLERLYLRDQAVREGWVGTSRFVEEAHRLDAAQAGLRQEFGDELYDWMLYAEGRPNRVAVTGVLPDSAAEAAGLRAGDRILRYDEQAVLAPNDLRDATSAGAAGAWVPVDVQRGGEMLRVLVPRGPLGVSLEPRSEEPLR